MKPILIVIAVVLFIVSFLYLLMWIPVVDRVVNPCKHYPKLLLDCKE